MEDAKLAEETKSQLALENSHVDQPPTEAQRAQQSAGKKSLSALAAARKPASSHASTLSRLAAAKMRSGGNSNDGPSLSKLASKSQAASTSTVRRPLTGLATKAAAGNGDVTMSSDADPETGSTQVKLSKLQQRLQWRGADTHHERGKEGHPTQEEEQMAADVWQLPSSSLFHPQGHACSTPSQFAGILAPAHEAHLGPQPDAIASEAINAGLEKLPKLPASQTVQRKPDINTAHVITPLRR